MKIHKKLLKTYTFIKRIQKIKNKKNEYRKNKIDEYIKNCKTNIKNLKKDLKKEFEKNKDIRNLNNEYLCKKNIVSVFDSVLIRTLEIPIDTLTDNLIIVQTYFFDVLKDIILNGFYFKNCKYIPLTASAGQIRTKKTIFIKKDLWEKHKNSLMCGLTIEDINKNGGVNINKYLAYLALCNSATDKWEDFDIKKSIVVEDMETTLKTLVDFVNHENYEITQIEKEIVINHTDGCGMILPKKNKKAMMVRLPWIKGLLVPFKYDFFIRIFNSKDEKCGIVKDIYGVEHDILKENIEIIFTKSQFKMWKYYQNKFDKDGKIIKSGWDIYIDNYLKYNCQAGKCNEEEDYFTNAKFNYQMLQTLVDIRDDELEIICKKTKEDINNVGKNRETKLKILGVIKSNNKKNYYQQSLEIYPELLEDVYSKKILKEVKKSMVKQARAAKLEINGKYTFICPDLYAFCEYLFLNNKKPVGILKNGEVCCKIYKKSKKLDCLRSPHLYMEHAVRNNIINSQTKVWFVTNGLYTSCHDPISKILMFDVDGDKSLVCADETIVKVAERNSKEIYPLYYEMKKADPQLITNENIYNGLKTAYSGGNIGVISNNITKIWNSKEINLNIIKYLCMENNFTID